MVTKSHERGPKSPQAGGSMCQLPPIRTLPVMLDVVHGNTLCHPPAMDWNPPPGAFTSHALEPNTVAYQETPCAISSFPYDCFFIKDVACSDRNWQAPYCCCPQAAQASNLLWPFPSGCPCDMRQKPFQNPYVPHPTPQPPAPIR